MPPEDLLSDAETATSAATLRFLPDFSRLPDGALDGRRQPLPLLAQFEDHGGQTLRTFQATARAVGPMNRLTSAADAPATGTPPDGGTATPPAGGQTPGLSRPERLAERLEDYGKVITTGLNQTLAIIQLIEKLPHPNRQTSPAPTTAPEVPAPAQTPAGTDAPAADNTPGSANGTSTPAPTGDVAATPQGELEAQLDKVDADLRQVRALLGEQQTESIPAADHGAANAPGSAGDNPEDLLVLINQQGQRFRTQVEGSAEEKRQFQVHLQRTGSRQVLTVVIGGAPAGTGEAPAVAPEAPGNEAKPAETGATRPNTADAPPTAPAPAGAPTKNPAKVLEQAAAVIALLGGQLLGLAQSIGLPLSGVGALVALFHHGHHQTTANNPSPTTGAPGADANHPPAADEAATPAVAAKQSAARIQPAAARTLGGPPRAGSRRGRRDRPLKGTSSMAARSAAPPSRSMLNATPHGFWSRTALPALVAALWCIAAATSGVAGSLAAGGGRASSSSVGSSFSLFRRGRLYDSPVLGMTRLDARASFGRPQRWSRVFPKQQRWVYQRVRLDNGVRVVQEDVLLFNREGQLIGMIWGTSRAGVRLEG